MKLDLFDKINIDNFLPFFIQVYSNLDSAGKAYKIESSLIESKVILTYHNLFEFQNSKFQVDERSNCMHCKKGFFSTTPEIIFLYPKTIYHLECYNNYIIKS